MPLILFDHKTSGTGSSASITISHTLGSGKNRVLFAGGCAYNKTVNSCKYGGSGGTSFTTLVLSENFYTGYYIVADGDTGAKDIYIEFSGTPSGNAAIVCEYSGVKTVIAASGAYSAQSYATSPIAPTSGSLIVGGMVMSIELNYGSDIADLTPAQTDRSGSVGTYSAANASDTPAVATTQEMSWSQAGNYGRGSVTSVGMEAFSDANPQMWIF